MTGCLWVLWYALAITGALGVGIGVADDNPELAGTGSGLCLAAATVAWIGLPT